ncbi:hypothetical protein [Delftia sp. PE138]|uniref:hypothetical protein n=1 Tax=Delftia sp. PE138 TaxID=1812483 RepID=UPI001BAF7D01|nr:hypothetical protein [Delftia sp. PE138]MBS3723445.1 hypothetical protein [Delftia sp. PE138]
MNETGYIAPKGRYVPPVLFNPYTGEPRDARDIASDPHGVLIVPPGAMLAAAPQAPAAPVAEDARDAALWREHVEKLDALIAYCPTCSQGYIATAEMTRDQIIFECGKTAGRAEGKRGAEAAPAAPAVDALSQAAQDVLAERRRQMEAEGYNTEHDDTHVMGEIGALAALYLMPDGARDWDTTSTTYGATLGQALLPEDWTMPTMGEDRRRDLVKGVACGLAELERWDRASAQTNERNAT